MVAYSKRTEPVTGAIQNVKKQLIGPDVDAFEAPPQPAYYDESLNGWVLSRYADVFAALHDERLRPVGSRTEAVPGREEVNAQRQLRAQTLTACSGQLLKSWQILFKELGRQMMVKLRPGTRTDILGNFAEPWALEVALVVAAAEKKYGAHLNTLARLISMASANPSDLSIRESAETANQELAQYLKSSPIPMMRMCG